MSPCTGLSCRACRRGLASGRREVSGAGGGWQERGQCTVALVTVARPPAIFGSAYPSQWWE